MRTVLLAFLISLSADASGQNVQAKIAAYVKEEGLDSFLVYSLTGGYILYTDSCLGEQPSYVFWRQKTQWFGKRFDYCRTRNSLELDSINPLQFYLRHKMLIDKEEIRSPEYRTVVVRNGKKQIETTYSLIDHQQFHRFQFFSNGSYQIMEAGDYYLRHLKSENGEVNIYHKENYNTKLRLLIDMTTTVLPKFEGQ
jgi:hypothetical protein